MQRGGKHKKHCCISTMLDLIAFSAKFCSVSFCLFPMASCKFPPRPSSENCRMCSCYRTARTATTSRTRTTTTTRNNINTNTVAQIESLLNAINIWWLTRLHTAPPRPASPVLCCAVASSGLYKAHGVHKARCCSGCRELFSWRKLTNLR